MPGAASWGSGLSDELWAHIFSLLGEEVFDLLEDSLLTEQEDGDLFSNHTKYHSLRLVCRQFRSVFLSRPTLSADLFLEGNASQAAILSLLERLQRPDVTIRRLLAECHRMGLAAVLGGAVTAASRPLQQLTSATIQGCSMMSLGMLSYCMALERCSFINTTCQLDLLALQALPKLSSLILRAQTSDAIFVGINRLAHLTNVEAMNAVVQIEQPCLFSSSLQELVVHGGDFQFMEGEGLCQCSALQSLCLTDCCVSCSTSEHTLDIVSNPPKVPGSLSALPQLFFLHLSVCSMMAGVFECSWLPQLTTLKHLCLEFTEGTTRFSLTDQILSLTNLQHLRIVQVMQRHSAETVLSLEVSWHLLPMLQTVKLYARFLKFDQRVLGLIRVSSLQTLEFHRCQVLDDLTAYYYGALLYNMAVRRPDVACYLGYKTAQTVLSMFEQTL